MSSGICSNTLVLLTSWLIYNNGHSASQPVLLDSTSKKKSSKTVWFGLCQPQTLTSFLERLFVPLDVLLSLLDVLEALLVLERLLEYTQRCNLGVGLWLLRAPYSTSQ